MTQTMRMAAVTALAVIAGAAWNGAEAAGSCSGVINSSEVSPLPRNLVVAPQRGMESMANPDAARRFAEGLRAAGINVADQGGNGAISIAASVTSAGGGGSTVSPSGTYPGFAWVSGMPVSGAGADIRGARVVMSVNIMNVAAAAIAWTAGIQCDVQTSDPGQLVEDLGRIVGAAIGKNYNRKSLASLLPRR